ALVAKKTIPTILGQFKAGAKSASIGGGVGYIYDVSNKVLYSEEDYLKPGIGTLLGAGVPIAGTAGKLSKASREAAKSGKLLEAIEEARTAINPLKSDIRRIEIKKGKEVDSVVNFILQEEIIPEVNLNKLDTKRAVDTLQGRKTNVDAKLSSVLDDVEKKNNLIEIREKAAKEITEQENNAEILNKKLEDLDTLMNQEIARNGVMITDKKLHELKSGMWSIGYDINRQTKSPVAKKIGRIMKEQIELNNSDFNVKRMNELSGKYAESIALLEGVHGNVLQGGKLGNWFSRAMGGAIMNNVIGRVPVLGKFAVFLGNYAGNKYSQFVNDPIRIMTQAIKKAKKAGLGKESEATIKLFEESLKRKDANWFNNKIRKIFDPEQKYFPEPKGTIIYAPDKYQNLPNKGSKLYTQDEAIELLNKQIIAETDPSRLLTEKAGASRKEAIAMPERTQSRIDKEEIAKIQEQIKRAKTPAEKDLLLSSVGSVYGIEVEKDEEGNITGFRFNPEKALIGMGLGVGALKGGKAIAKSAKGLNKADDLVKEAKIKGIAPEIKTSGKKFE
ncbi:hypothetical protein MEO93_26095, partial [Dolichospermum sp. ST_sed3]|nr:hypothetical protein [Dolichospermum sp. ST_sed3]